MQQTIEELKLGTYDNIATVCRRRLIRLDFLTTGTFSFTFVAAYSDVYICDVLEMTDHYVSYCYQL